MYTQRQKLYICKGICTVRKKNNNRTFALWAKKKKKTENKIGKREEWEKVENWSDNKVVILSMVG